MISDEFKSKIRRDARRERTLLVMGIITLVIASFFVGMYIGGRETVTIVVIPTAEAE